MSKSLCFRELAIRSKVVSNFVTLSLLYIYSIIYYIYYFNRYILLPYYYYHNILCFNTLRVGSNIIFLILVLTTLLPYLILKKLISYYSEYITLIYLQNLYTNVTIYKYWYIEKSYIYVHTYTYMIYTHTRAYTRTRVHTYIYTIHIHFINILCKNCTKIYLNYLMYHFNCNTLIICKSFTYIT